MYSDIITVKPEKEDLFELDHDKDDLFKHGELEKLIKIFSRLPRHEDDECESIIEPMI